MFKKWHSRIKITFFNYLFNERIIRDCPLIAKHEKIWAFFHQKRFQQLQFRVIVEKCLTEARC